MTNIHQEMGIARSNFVGFVFSQISEGGQDEEQHFQDMENLVGRIHFHHAAYTLDGFASGQGTREI